MTRVQSDEEAAKSEAPEIDSQDQRRMESSRSQSPGSSAESAGSSSGRDPSSPTTENGREDVEVDAHHLRQRYPPRVFSQRDLEELEVEIQEAFIQGDPRKAWNLTQQLIHKTRTLIREAAIDRFKVNFGSKTCAHCAGLKAGPGVLATCYQIRQCHYDNVKESTTSKQKQLIDQLTKA